MPPDLIVYALVAAGLVFWLRSVLGTRHGEEREQPNPFLGSETTDIPLKNGEGQKPVMHSAEEQIISLAEEPRKNYSVANKTAEIGLIEISKADKAFDIDVFLEGAQDAFVYIVESFAEGDREVLRELLADDVYNAFEGAISQREERKETQSTEIHAVRKAEVIDAKMEGKDAKITVRFVAQENSVTRDEDGNIITGNPDRNTEIIDIWTFGRPVKSKNPTWALVETRGDFEGDNDLIPDTH